jgi:hypothetical protein
MSSFAKSAIKLGVVVGILAVFFFCLINLLGWGTCPSTIARHVFLPTPQFHGLNYALRASYVVSWSCETRQDVYLVRYKNSRETNVELIASEFESIELSRDSEFRRSEPRKNFESDIVIDYFWNSKTKKLTIPVKFRAKEDFRWFDVQIEFLVKKN